MEKRRKIFIAVLCIALTVSGCGGGGGGGGSSSSGRTTHTALRIVHGSLDEAPITVQLPDHDVQTARFGELTSYVQMDEGPQLLTVHRANAPAEVLKQFSFDFEKNTEYTLFLSGVSRQDTAEIAMITDRVIRPAQGLAAVRFMNSFQSRAELELTVGDRSLGTVDLGAVSDYVELPAGPYHCRIARDNGAEISSFDIVLPDRGEATVVASGAETPFFVTTPVYMDLD